MKSFIGYLQCQRTGEWGTAGDSAIACVKAMGPKHAQEVVKVHCPGDWICLRLIEVPFRGVWHPGTGKVGF